MIDFNNPGVGFGLGLAGFLAIPFVIFRKKISVTFKPMLALFLWYILWMVSYTIGGNILFAVMFPGRIYWIWSLLVGGMCAVFVGLIAFDLTNGNWLSKICKTLLVWLIRLAVLG